MRDFRQTKGGLPGNRQGRRGVVAVEAALVLPILILLMIGTWEVGRMVQVTRTLNDAAREGARLAAGGSNNGTSATVSMVQQAVRDYLTSGGFPSDAVSGATIQLTNLSANSWTDPGDALPLDAFSLTVTIPSGTPFNSLRWVLLSSITGISQLSSQVQWCSANDAEVVVNSQLPF